MKKFWTVLIIGVMMVIAPCIFFLNKPVEKQEAPFQPSSEIPSKTEPLGVSTVAQSQGNQQKTANETHNAVVDGAKNNNTTSSTQNQKSESISTQQETGQKEQSRNVTDSSNNPEIGTHKIQNASLDEMEAIERQKMLEIQSYTGVEKGNSSNTYDMKNSCPRDNANYATYYGGLVCQSTSYVSWKAYESFGILNTWGGNSYNYVNASGYYVPYTGIYSYVNSSPAPRTIAVDTSSEYGHVMWVESVNNNGTINVTEYNVNLPAIGCYVGDFCSRNGVSAGSLYFVHFE